jgi:hypothetical protein
MSLKQVETFYLPGLKRIMLTSIDERITPCLFFDEDKTSPLEYLAELPEGRVLGLFDASDMFKAKEILGGTLCISGMMLLIFPSRL